MKTIKNIQKEFYAYWIENFYDNWLSAFGTVDNQLVYAKCVDENWEKHKEPYTYYCDIEKETITDYDYTRIRTFHFYPVSISEYEIIYKHHKLFEDCVGNHWSLVDGDIYTRIDSPYKPTGKEHLFYKSDRSEYDTLLKNIRTKEPVAIFVERS